MTLVLLSSNLAELNRYSFSPELKLKYNLVYQLGLDTWDIQELSSDCYIVSGLDVDDTQDLREKSYCHHVDHSSYRPVLAPSDFQLMENEIRKEHFVAKRYTSSFT